MLRLRILRDKKGSGDEGSPRCNPRPWWSPMLALVLSSGCSEEPPCKKPPHPSHCVASDEEGDGDDVSGDGDHGDGDGLDGLPLWEGERVLFGTDLFDPVCAGTLRSLDATVESIEKELMLPASAEKIRFYLLADDVIADLCGPPHPACFKGDAVYSSKFGMSGKRHELVHARTAQLGIRGGRLFDEGIAEALDRSGGCLASETCMMKDLDALLAGELTDHSSYRAAGDLVHGLLMTHGPAAVLAFMDESDKKLTPDEIRALYLEHFDSAIDEDFYAFMRGPFDEYTLPQTGCDGLLVLPADSAGRVEVDAVIDCSSPDVLNNYSNQDRGVIVWGFVVTPEQSGVFRRNAAVGVKRCDPLSFNHIKQSGDYPEWWINSFDDEALLAPGLYQIGWGAEFGESIHIEIGPPCVFETGGCPAGQQCNIWNECLPQIANPAALGEPCEQQPDGPLACETGSRCLGGVCVAECDATAPCMSGRACTRLRVCGASCDLLAQDCEPGFACVPAIGDSLTPNGLGACIPAGEGQHGDPCDWRGSDCAVGLSCEANAGGLCRQLCDAAAPACPDEAPFCVALHDGPVGTCSQSAHSNTQPPERLTCPGPDQLDSP